MKNPFEGKEIWFFTGSQGLYGEDTLKQVASQSKEVAAALENADDIPVKIVWRPVLTDSNSCLLYTSPSPRDKRQSRMPSSA